jgi:hypothetical protein
LDGGNGGFLAEHAEGAENSDIVAGNDTRRYVIATYLPYGMTRCPSPVINELPTVCHPEA